MELIKKNIHMDQIKCQSNLQLTLDDDYNVPDVKPDIERIIKEQGEVRIQEISPMNGKLLVKGALEFNILYIGVSNGQVLHNMKGAIPFEEMVNMDEVCEEDLIRVKWELEDMTTSVINSRKINIKAIVSLHFTAEKIYDEEAAIRIEEEKIEFQTRQVPLTSLSVSKKDTCRIKDEVMISLGKPNIAEILYSEYELQNKDARLSENKIILKGDLKVFILYVGDTQDQMVQYYETQLPVNCTLDCNGCDERMILDVDISVLSADMQVKPDDDGEERILDIEAVLELDMKVYEEEELELLSDFYSIEEELVPIKKGTSYKHLLMKNNSKVRLLESVSLESGQPQILQICNASGQVKLDEKTIEENGILVEGILEVQILYITEDDQRPMGVLKGMIPFSHLVEVKGIMPNSIYDIRASVDQLNTLMVSGNEVEIKAAINLDTIAFHVTEEKIIVDVENRGSLLEKIQDLPSIVGYIVEDGDTLWTIAKTFFTTVDKIKELNALETDKVKRGDKLLLIKEVGGML